MHFWTLPVVDTGVGRMAGPPDRRTMMAEREQQLLAQVGRPERPGKGAEHAILLARAMLSPTVTVLRTGTGRQGTLAERPR